MASADIQARINPPVAGGLADLTGQKTRDIPKAIDDGNPAAADFTALIQSSNSYNREEKEAQRLATGAKDNQELLQKQVEQSAGKEQRVPKNKLGKDDFLKLFITQLQSQDPLSPKDSSEMAAQLAHFDSLEQMMNVNKNLEKMGASADLSRGLDLINYVGKDVTINGGRTRIEQGKASDVMFNLAADVSDAKIQVRDGSGAIVAEKPMGVMTKGDHTESWSGLDKLGKPLPSGPYTYSIVARGMNGEDIPVSVTTRVRVTGIDLADGGTFYTDNGRVNVTDIRAVGTPGFQLASKEADDAEQKTRAALANVTGNADAVGATKALMNQPTAQQAEAEGVSDGLKRAAEKATAATSAEGQTADVRNEKPTPATASDANGAKSPTKDGEKSAKNESESKPSPNSDSSTKPAALASIGMRPDIVTQDAKWLDQTRSMR